MGGPFRPPRLRASMARGCLTCQKPVQSGFASVQRPKKGARRRLQSIRRKKEGKKQKYNSAYGRRRKKRATPSTARITEAIVSSTAQISNRNTSRAARRDNAKAKGATNIFSSIFKTSFIYPSYLYFITPVREHKCCERLVNPVLNLFSNKNGWSNETIRF